MAVHARKLKLHFEGGQPVRTGLTGFSDVAKGFRASHPAPGGSIPGGFGALEMKLRKD
jgi:hypothetical protein